MTWLSFLWQVFTGLTALSLGAFALAAARYSKTLVYSRPDLYETPERLAQLERSSVGLSIVFLVAALILARLG